MAFFGDTMHRQRMHEIMDDPGLEMARHVQALQGLERINRVSGVVRILWSPIHALARETGNRCLRVLDIGTGAGDLPIALWGKGKRNGLLLEIDGCDRSIRAVEYARRRAQQASAQVRFFQLDAVAEDIPAGYDVTISSLFLHHFEEGQAVSLLRKQTAAAKRMVLVNDLLRGVVGLAVVHVGTRLLSRSEVVHADGPRSVRAAYTVDEAHRIAEQAGMVGARVQRRWPCRFLLTWMRR